MKTLDLSICFCTQKVDDCKEFYHKYFSAHTVFDCGWYINLRLGQDGPTLQFMQPRENMPTFEGKGIMLNFKVENVDEEFARLNKEGLEITLPLEEHPWGDKGFSVTDPLGNSLYIYSEQEPSEEFKKYFKE